MNNNHKAIYKLLRDSYEGMGGFLDGSYLRKHERETEEKYKARKELAYYLNYFRPCVDAHVAPIFKTPAIRECNGMGKNAWSIFADDVDFKGNRLKDLMKQAGLKAKINGVSFIVMDRVENIEDNSLAALERDRNNLPYAFVVDPGRVEEVTVDKFGRIVKFKYCEADAYQENAVATRTLTPDGWELVDSKGLHKGTWNLGMAPVISIPSKLDDETFNPLPPSEFISIAKTNLAIYNMSSWLNDILINQTFSVLVYPSNSTDDLILGTNNALGFPSEASHEPKFIAPAADPANILHNEIDRLQQECYRMAGVVNITGVKSEQSGVAKQWDFERTNQVLSDFADILENAEILVSDLFKRFTGLDFEYTVNYPNDFSIADVQTELNNAQIARGLNFGDEFDLRIFQRVVTSYLPEIKDADMQAMVQDFKERMALERLDEVHAVDDETEAESDANDVDE